MPKFVPLKSLWKILFSFLHFDSASILFKPAIKCFSFQDNVFNFLKKKAVTPACVIFLFVIGIIPTKSFAQTNFSSGTWSSVSISSSCTSTTSNYILNATNATSGGNSTSNSFVASGKTVTITLPSGFTLSTITGGALNGNTIGTITATATTVSFSTPVSIAKGASFTIVLNGLTNNSAAGNYQLSMTIGNATGGNNIFTTSANSQFTITQNATISLTSAAGTNAQTPCINTAITNITYAIAGGGTGATVTGLPAGINGSYNAGVFTISGTPTAAAGTYNYTVNTTGTCTQTSANGSITIQPNATISLTSATGTEVQVTCINTAITNITYAIGGGGTGATVTGLPAGINGFYNAGVLTISGIPTAAAGTNNYTVNTTGTCTQTSANGSITIKPNATIILTSATGTDAQTPCINTAIINITYAIGGGGTGATVTGLPTGISGSYNAGVFTISGVPTAAAGTYNYTINTTGTCTQKSANGSITIKPDATISLTSFTGTDAQALCNNSPISAITYVIADGGTGAVTTGLPSGLTSSYNAGIFTISGTPNTAAGTYNYTVTTTGTCAQATANGSIIVKPQPQGSLSANGPFCSSGNGMLTWTSSAGTGPFTIIYNDGSSDQTQNNVISGTAFDLLTNPLGATNTYAIVSVTDNNGCESNTGFTNGSATIIVHQPVNITLQPSDETVCATFPATFQVNATGDNLMYQWYRNGSLLSDGGRISGAATNTLNYSQVSAANNGATYHVVVSGTSPCPSVTSVDAVLNVDQKIIINTQPVSQTICENQMVSFSIDATASDPLSYQWRKSGTDIPGETNSTLIISNVAASDAAEYDVIISGPAGYSCPTIFSTKATLTVNPLSVGGSVSGTSTVCSGSNNGTLTLSGQTGNVVRWESSTDGGATWTTIANTTTSQSYINLTQTTLYRAVVQSGVCSIANSSSATITVNPVSVGGSLGGTTSVCSGSNNGTLTLSGQTGNVVRWESSVNGGATWTTIANTTTLQSYTNLTQTIQYRAVVQSSVCSISNSSSAIITVNPISVGGAVSGAATVCSGSNSGTLTLSGQTGTIIRWESSTDGGITWTTITNTTTTQSYTNIIQTTQFRAVVQSGACSITNSSSATITANPVSIGGAVSGTATVCSGSNSGTLTLSGQTGNVVRWESSVNSGTTWTTIANTTTSQSYTNLTQTTQYRAIVQSGVCSIANSSSVIITVNPVSVGGTLTPSSAIGCSGSNNGSISLSGQTGSVIRWESSVNAGTSWTAISNTSTTQAYNNLTQTTIYRAVVQSGVCTVTANSSNAVIVVNPTFTPTVTATPVTICLGQSSIFSASGYSTATGPFAGGDFNNANPAGWSVTNNGVSINFPASADNQTTNPWSETNGPKTFNSVVYNSQLGGKFAIANGAETTTLETPVFSTIGLASASLQFYQAFNFNAGTTGKIEISLDGGVTYNTILQQYTGPSSFGTSNGGFSLVSIPLTNYLSQSNLRIRFSFNGTAGSNWAIDNVGIPDPYQPIAYKWTPATYLSVDTGRTVTATPTTAGTFTYNVNTLVGGCAGGNTNVTLTVNPLPAISASLTSQTICSGSSIMPVSFTSNISPTTYNWTRNNTAAVTGIAASGTGTISGVLTNTTSNPVTVTFTITPTANTCGGTPITISVIVNPVPQASISGSATICNGQSVTLSINVTGSNGLISGTLSDGTPFNGTAPTVLVNVAPTVTTTYTISSLTNGSCAAAGLTGSATVICPNGAAGLWTGAKDKDWFNCLNWADGKIPTTSVDVNIPSTAANVCNIDAANSPYASAYGNVAQSKSLTVDNNTLSFINASDSLITAGNVTIKNTGTINMTNGGKFEVQGSWDDQVSTAGLGFKDGIGNVILTGTVTQTISAAKQAELFYNLKINKTSGIASLAINVTVDNNLTLTKGAFATNNNLFTWSNISGSIVLPATYTDSYICTCNSDGSPVTPTGSNGFRIINVRGSSEQMFPVSSDFVSPNRMSLNMNNSTADDFTVVVGKGDIGGTSAPKVNRIWYVSEATPGGSTTTMKLYFTKRNWGVFPYGSAQDEVEDGFLWSDPHLVQKDNNNLFVNVATTGTADVPNYTGNAFNTEIYGRYFIDVSSDNQGNKNGITAFNKFSVVNIGNIILPVTLTNIKAYQKNNTIDIDWTALNELNMDHYEVERSANGTSFNTIENVDARNNDIAENYYTVHDTRPVLGNNFYRIKAVNKNGEVSYSVIVVVNIGTAKSSVTVQPNPVFNKIINLQLNNVAAGNYTIVISNMSGQQIYNQKIEHGGGNAMQQIILPSSIARGVYIVSVFNKVATYNIHVVIE
ncbi:T9SS type A sorting domain-containing protein [Panacibacter ginsenosidivorans]|uniref:T9SS type A sorting domain-containing protein n=1 Tax=Panacibacter ginsenosidivorans TaxID=1813871 RepID=A0A5B8V5J2_9BACT|nr:T9SS type A sorting domain-containing protein [Panacibacter ginsenosidivorans]QEC66767.1 T9SS type A sorting domain-containing protein [Panacibacter ginsenosidivorans]